MKRIAWLLTSSIFLAGLTVTLARAQDASLGDYARQVRKQKAPPASSAKKFDNDNLPADDKLSVVGPAPPEPGAAEAAAAANNDGAPAVTNRAKPTPAATDGSVPSQTPASAGADQKPVAGAADKGSAEDGQAQKQQMLDGWKKRIEDQKGQLDLLARELDVQNREYRLRAAAFYADAGNRLRNSAAWDKEDAQFKDQIAAKQKQLDDAKKQLEDMQEEARKAGVPSSARE
jgi:hypothetical protein